ncbi:neuropeptide FF receptor 2-like [Montipora foliosa]|uniref:neuropeptide FF receptor 2-like n=1 Tax=Montipora foliosa TaxID=591990 RepID=UPI0035F14539
MAFNNSSLSSASNLYAYNTPEKAVIVLANALIFCLAIPANSIVIIVISTVQNVRTPTSTFLLNLCVADIVIALLYIPFITVDLYMVGHWVFGDFMCKLVSFAFYLATYSSILILTALSVERYISVCLSRRMRLTTKRAFITTLSLWMVTACFALPLFIGRESYLNPSLNIEFCIITWPSSYVKIYTLTTLALFYVVPIAFMAIVYYKIGRKVWTSADKTRTMKLSNKHTLNSKLRLTKIAMAIILSFVISWTPLNTLNVLFFFAKRDFPLSAETVRVLYPIIHGVAFSNCALNPLLYCYMSQNFRKAFKVFRHRRSRSYLSDSTSALSTTRRFSRWSKRIFEPEKHLSNGLNGLPEKEENHGASRSSQQDLNGTKESILIVSAL